MGAPISVIIPVLDAQGSLPAVLESLMEGLGAGLIAELILSDGGSQDATAEIAEAAGALWVTGPASRGGQLRRGAGAAKGDWLLFVHADSRLAPGWSEAAAAHLSTGRAGWFRLSFRAQGLAPRLVAGWANLRARRLGLPYGDQGLLVPAALYHEAGGFPDIPLMEDVALARALRGRLAPIPAGISTSAERYQRAGWLRRGARNLWTLARYFAGADPEKLARAYRR